MARRRRGALRVGCSGYQYPHWRGRLYPKELPKRAWLEHYAARFDTVEINNTFYRLPSAETLEGWRERVPRGFLFALKFSRYGSHMKRLKDPEASLEPFFELAERLGPRLGPVLVQLPPQMKADAGRLDAFLAAAPRRRRIAVELRDPSWLREPVLRVLERRRAALVLHDLQPDPPRAITADWTYLRFHGTGPRYSGGYSAQKLAAVARRVRAWRAEGIDVHAYFNNDARGRAVEDAEALRRYAERG